MLEEPPTTDVGEKVRLKRAGAVTVRAPFAVEYPRVAVRLSTSFTPTEADVTVKVALEAPDAIETVDG